MSSSLCITDDRICDDVCTGGEFRMKRKKRTEIKIMHDKAWVALSKYKRRSGICQRCGKQKEPGQLDAHHLVKKARGNYAKFEPDNIVALCGWYCHRNWWHGQA